MEQEVWRNIRGYEEYYQVSNLGNFRSFKKGYWKEIQKTLSGKGYRKVCLCNDSKPKYFLAHRIVAETFLDRDAERNQVNHKDGDKTNNCITNLEWCTRSENMIHSMRVLGFVPVMARNHPDKGKFGRDNRKSKPVKQFTKDGIFIKEWGNAREVKRELGIENTNIGRCCMGRAQTAGGFRWSF